MKVHSFFTGYRRSFILDNNVTVWNLPEGVEMVMLSDNVNLDIELITPIAMDKELRFDKRGDTLLVQVL